MNITQAINQYEEYTDITLTQYEKLIFLAGWKAAKQKVIQ